MLWGHNSTLSSIKMLCVLSTPLEARCIWAGTHWSGPTSSPLAPIPLGTLLLYPHQPLHFQIHSGSVPVYNSTASMDQQVTWVWFLSGIPPGPVKHHHRRSITTRRGHHHDSRPVITHIWHLQWASSHMTIWCCLGATARADYGGHKSRALAYAWW